MGGTVTGGGGGLARVAQLAVGPVVGQTESGTHIVVAVGLIMLFVLVVLIVVFGVILWVQLRPADPTGPGPDGTLRFQGHLLPAGQALSIPANLSAESFGRVEVTPGELVWTADTGQVWRVPIAALVVRSSHGFFTFGYPGVTLELPGVGAWRLRVSDRRINRFMQNDIKRGRDARLGRELAAALLARGARPAVAPAG